MVEAEGEIEGRVAIPGALGIEKDWAGRTDEDVLRADIAMDQRQRRRRRAVGERNEIVTRASEYRVKPATREFTLDAERDLQREVDLIEEIIRAHGIEKLPGSGHAYLARDR